MRKIPSADDGVHISLIIPVRQGGSILWKTSSRLNAALLRIDRSFEILLVPNRHPQDIDDGTEAICREIAAQLPQVRVIPHRGEVGKGAALQTGMRKARGEVLFFTDADLPYDPSFINESLKKMSSGADFVTANRRIAGSQFVCSVGVLPLVYRRHCYGLLFNMIARLLFGLKTRDTQAGFKAFSRRMAEAVIRLHSCPGFLADVEYFIICAENNFNHAEIPVKFYLHQEKSTVRLYRELKNSIVWFSVLFLRRALGKYRDGKTLSIQTNHGR